LTQILTFDKKKRFFGEKSKCGSKNETFVKYKKFRQKSELLSKMEIKKKFLDELAESFDF